MKRTYDMAVVMPIGPGSNTGFIKDTIDSLEHFIACSYKLILADDSQTGAGPEVKEMFPHADVLCTTRPMGGWAGLYITLALAYRHAVEHYNFRLMLKLDTDALVIGPEPEKDALELFEADKKMGIAGQYPLDYEGSPWDIGWPRDRVLNGATTWKFIKRPLANRVLRKLYLKAADNGYRAGESVFGGSYFMSSAMLQVFIKEGLLPHYTLRFLNLGEDHLFALLAKSTGFNLGNLASGSLPFGCAWKGLPAPPEQLLNDGKKIIHSTRSWNNWDESMIREFFRSKRN